MKFWSDKKFSHEFFGDKIPEDLHGFTVQFCQICHKLARLMCFCFLSLLSLLHRVSSFTTSIRGSRRPTVRRDNPPRCLHNSWCSDVSDELGTTANSHNGNRYNKKTARRGPRQLDEELFRDFCWRSQPAFDLYK